MVFDMILLLEYIFDFTLNLMWKIIGAVFFRELPAIWVLAEIVMDSLMLMILALHYAVQSTVWMLDVFIQWFQLY